MLLFYIEHFSKSLSTNKNVYIAISSIRMQRETLSWDRNLQDIRETRLHVPTVNHISAVNYSGKPPPPVSTLGQKNHYYMDLHFTFLSMTL